MKNKYILNDCMIFDFDMSTLSLNDSSDESVFIPNSSARLLLILINNHGEAVSREKIFKKVWDDYGMISGNNNLNQCVSRLRRVIKNLGIEDEVITTIPKVGFMLHHDIIIKYCDPPENSVSDQESISIISGASFEPEFRSESKKSPSVGFDAEIAPKKSIIYRHIKTVVTAGMLGGIILLLFITVYLMNSFPRQEAYLGKINSCDVFIERGATSNAINTDILISTSLRTVECGDNEFLLVARSDKTHSYISNFSRLFFLHCHLLHQQQIEICSNLKIDNFASSSKD